MGEAAMSEGIQPTSARIAAELRERIRDGRLRPGDRVPSTRALVRRHGVAMATATKALAALQAEGLVRGVPGVGTVVVGRATPPAGTPAGGAPDRPARPPARRRRPDDEAPLAADRIVAAAVAVADREGLAGLSMRRVANELGVATMSLYRHVTDKDDLLMQMMDATIAAHPLPAAPPPSWRDGLEVAGRALWATFRRHPWLPSALSLTRPQLLPGGLAYSEWVLRALAGSGMDPLTTFTTHLTLFTFVRGTAMNLELEADAEALSGQSSEEWMAEQEPALQSLIAGGEYPHFLRVLSAMDFDFDLDGLFDFGLQRLLDGLERLAGPPS
jgi:AcrR family transcriptional regulator